MDEKRNTEQRRGEHNELGYRNVDEDADYDERGSQGPGRGDADRERDDERAGD
jgi:hypothetical protein